MQKDSTRTFTLELAFLFFASPLNFRSITLRNLQQCLCLFIFTYSPTIYVPIRSLSGSRFVSATAIMFAFTNVLLFLYLFSCGCWWVSNSSRFFFSYNFVRAQTNLTESFNRFIFFQNIDFLQETPNNWCESSKIRTDSFFSMHTRDSWIGFQQQLFVSVWNEFRLNSRVNMRWENTHRRKTMTGMLLTLSCVFGCF